MPMEPNELRAALEAILFVSTEPVKVDDLTEAFPDAGAEAVTAQLDEIRKALDTSMGGFTLEQTAGGWRFATRAEHDPMLKKYFSKKGENRLSLAALETLAITAYRQPVTAPEISEIRGVNSTAVVRTLLERRMVRVSGRKNVVGSPFLYRTTREFLVHFGLNDIRDLPRLEEFGDLIGENINDDLVAAINSAEATSPADVQEITDANERDRAEAEALAELSGGASGAGAGRASPREVPAGGDDTPDESAAPSEQGGVDEMAAHEQGDVSDSSFEERVAAEQASESGDDEVESSRSDRRD